MPQFSARIPEMAKNVWGRIGGSRRLAACRRAARRAVLEVKLRDPWIYSIFTGTRVGGGGPLCLHYLGRQRFAQDFLIFFERVHEDSGIRQTLKPTPALPALWWQSRPTGGWPAGAHVQVVDRALMPLESCAQSPAYVPFIEARLAVATDIEKQVAAVRSKGHRRKLQSALKKDFSWRKSHSLDDFEIFYSRMYEPFVKERFRFDPSVISREDMRRVFVRRGFLLLLEDEGRPVSGAMMYVADDNPRCLAYWKYGLADAAELSPSLFGERNGMTEAMVLKYAVEHRFEVIDFGLTRALPGDGIFTHKKRLGCDFILPPELASAFAFRVHPSTRPALFAAQPVVVRRNGGLTTWMGHVGPLLPASKEALSEHLRAGVFPSVRGLELFTDSHDLATRATLDEILAELTRELGVPCVARATGG